MNAAEVLELVARLEVAYREELTDPERKLWIEELAAIEPTLAWTAAETRIRSDERFMPRVGEIVSACARAASPSAGDAWELVLSEVRRVGIYGESRLPEPVARAVAVMGWAVICDSRVDDPWIRKDFERVYEGVLDGEHRRQAAITASDIHALPGEMRELVAGIGEPS